MVKLQAVQNVIIFSNLGTQNFKDLTVYIYIVSKML